MLLWSDFVRTNVSKWMVIGLNIHLISGYLETEWEGGGYCEGGEVWEWIQVMNSEPSQLTWNN